MTRKTRALGWLIVAVLTAPGWAVLVLHLAGLWP